MGSVDMTTTEAESNQPGVIVPDSTEEQITAHDLNTDQPEVTVNVEGDSEQPNNNEMSDGQLYAAWKEEKRKRKAKAEENNQQKQRIDELEQTVKQLQKTQREVMRGERPDPLDFGSTEEFYAALDKWQQGGEVAPSVTTDIPQPNPQPAQAMTDEQEFEVHKSELSLKKLVPDYDDAKDRVNQQLKDAFGMQTNQVSDEIGLIAHQYGIDPAKVFYALDKMPGKIQELKRNAQNIPAISNILRDLESRVVTKQPKTIESKPEPNLGGGGSIDAIQAKVTKAQEAYRSNPSMANYQALQAAKNQAKAAKTN